MSTSPELAEKIQMFKGLSPGSPGLSFSVSDNKGQAVGVVRAVNPELASDLSLLEQMTRWRKNYSDLFYSKFLPTEERTKKWLETVVLPDSSRIMFLVEDIDGTRLGQYGLCSISPGEAQLDNGIRGESGGHPRLFYFVQLAIIHFCFSCLDVQRVFTSVFSHNIMAILLHRSVGLSISASHFLKQTEHLGETRFEFVEDETVSNTDLKSYTLSIDRLEFYRRHPSMLNKGKTDVC